MLRVVDLRSSDLTACRDHLPRAPFDVTAAVEVVAPICDDVRDHGVEALVRCSQRFDGVVPTVDGAPTFRVPAEVRRQALAALDPRVRRAFEVAVERRRAVAAIEAREPEVRLEVAPGAVVSQRLVPVNRVGLYVPGGLAPLASSVLMNVVPAAVAGVGSVAVAAPPSAAHDGWPHPTILALCELLGVEEVLAVGGAQAVAMFAFGVPGVCERVDLVTGPGNLYVTAAKRRLRGVVGIDSEAGPTEILVLADDTADPRHVAADLISQAEHGLTSGSVLVTASPALADAVQAEVARQVAGFEAAERIGAALAAEQSAIVLVDDLDAGLVVVDAYAAEHLEIQTADAAAVAERVTNAGAIFVGPWSPVSLGDYAAGSTHVLPTAGAAAFSSGLQVQSFQRQVHVIDYSEAALREIADDVETFAHAERLPAHAAAVRIRFAESGAEE